MSITLKTNGNNNESSAEYGGSGGYVRGSVPNVDRYETHIDDSYYYKTSKKSGLDIKAIGNIDYYSSLAIYAVYAVEILAVIFLALSGAGSGLIEVLGVIHCIVVLADSIFQVVWRKESILLILVAVFLGGLYPIGRSWILDGSPDKISILFVLGYTGSLLFLFASLM